MHYHIHKIKTTNDTIYTDHSTKQRSFNRRIWLNAALLLLCVSLFAQAEIDYPKGEIIDSLICRMAPDQNYALYLPSSYSPHQEWPIIFAFDPGAQGRTAVEKFQKAAETFGLIIAGSNNARNGPWEPIVKAAQAMWQDIDARFPINKNRIYSTGFSGGARAAALFPKMIGLKTAGIIGCGAGIAQGQNTEDLNTSAYCGIVGLKDGNYREMRRLQDSLAGGGLSHRFLYFKGGHEWPPEEECLHAVEWMEIQAMRQNLEPQDAALIDKAYSREMSLAASWEKMNPFLALGVYDEILHTYTSLLDTAPLQEARTRLAASKIYKKAKTREKRILDEEEKTLLRFSRIAHQIENRTLQRTDFPQILREFDLDQWEREAAQSKDTEREWMAGRILFAFWFDCQNRGVRLLSEKYTAPAIIFLRLALEVSEAVHRNPRYLYFNLACAYGQEKDASQAVKALESAVAAGFDEYHLLEEDHDFDPIRNSREFQSLLQSIRKPPNR